MVVGGGGWGALLRREFQRINAQKTQVHLRLSEVSFQGSYCLILAGEEVGDPNRTTGEKA
jgi:hypothetical protein